MKVTLFVSAKCSDLCNMRLVAHDDQTTNRLIGERDGYVPSWFPNPNAKHDGDYIELFIDVATGRILNWKSPTQAQLRQDFKKG